MTEDLVASMTPDVGAPLDHGADTNIDRLSLEQALRDFEVANRRVIDLAHRVASLNRELLETRAELSRVNGRLQEASMFAARLRASRLFPLVRVAARAARTVRR